MTMMIADRRRTLTALGAGLGMAGLAGRAQAATSTSDKALEPTGAKKLRKLSESLATLARRRDFKTVPMILNDRDQWDATALDMVLKYDGSSKQCWDNTELTGPWLNVMRNSMNAQIWSFGHSDFLCVSATHGSAHLAIYDDKIWEKYQFAKIAGPGVTANRFVATPPAAARDPKNYEDGEGVYSPADNSITILQKRGAVFMACHNAIWELASRLAATTNPDHLSVDAVAAELTNHLIAGIVLTPGAVATLVELQRAGFAYSR